jgi:phosphopantothenoylcysteine decarboxylase/phosphopantothenate--cysteine ligase
MGYALAEECRDRGAEVILVSGPTNIEPPFGVSTYNVNTNNEMLNEVMNHFESMDIVIKSAAVADYKTSIYSHEKIKKHDDELKLNFVKDTDILKKLGSMKKKQILIGFAAESNDLLKNADLKLKSKNLDYIVANDIMSTDAGFASENNKVTILCKDGRIIPLEKMSKRNVARQLLNLIKTTLNS